MSELYDSDEISNKSNNDRRTKCNKKVEYASEINKINMNRVSGSPEIDKGYLLVCSSNL